jgi:thiamine biosynthesis protein ThiS
MVEINGHKVDWEESMTVTKLLEIMNYTFPLIIVRVNGELVDKKDWDQYLVPRGAKVQALHQIAGG